MLFNKQDIIVSPHPNYKNTEKEKLTRVSVKAMKKRLFHTLPVGMKTGMVLMKRNLTISNKITYVFTF